MKQTAMQQLIKYLKEHSMEHTGTYRKATELLEVEKEQLIDFWVEGNKQGWEQQTDWPEDAEKYYDQTFTQ